MTDDRSKKADEVVRGILKKADDVSKYGTASAGLGEGVDDAIRALERERDISEEQLSRRAVL